MKLLHLLALFAGFALSASLTPVIIPVLKRFKFGQEIRKEGNETHYKKQGTPTMGGIVFVPVITVLGILFSFLFPEDVPMDKVLPVMLLTFAFGVIGFIDDFLKIRKHQSEGFKPLQKLLCQIAVSVGFAVYCYFTPSIGDGVIMPFTGGKVWNMGWLYFPFVLIVLLGTDNGTNLTDGIDGLLASVTTVVAFFLAILGLRTGSGIAVPSLIAAGALLGYLLYNAHPAKLFMGDTGSLALGGLVAGAAIVSKSGWFILLFGFIYVIEVVSDILQVAFFKLTHGKRIFKMAPIHHHFEKCGLSEVQVVWLFTGVTVLAAVLAYAAM